MRDSERNITLVDSVAISEYIDETVSSNPMISGTAQYRAETRRLVAWFDEQFYGDVTQPLLHERMKKRLIDRQPPDSKVLREAMKLANGHLDYIDYLIDHRAWLAGSTMTMADLAAAAQISVADYLGGSIGTVMNRLKRGTLCSNLAPVSGLYCPSGWKSSYLPSIMSR